MEQPVPTVDPALEDALEGVEGWFSPEQVERVAARASEVPAGGTIVEIGSFRGRSMIAIGLSAPEGVEIVAIDPHAGNDRGPQEIDGFEDEAALDNKVFLANLERAGVRDRVTYVRKFSHDAHGDVSGDVDLLHIDGAHRFKPAGDDIASWGARVRPGGAMLIHDSFSSIGVTAVILRHLVWSRDFGYVGRTASLAEYRRAKASLGNALRQLAQLPWFARNLAVKLALVLRLRSGDWPY
jgi:Methyltransferase domain